MSTEDHIVKFVFAALGTLVFGVFLARKWFKALFISMAAMLIMIGISGLLLGRLRQQYDAAPPLTGSAATIGNILLILGGLVILALSIRRGHKEPRSEPAAPPNGGPAEGVENFEAGGGPPSES